MFVTVAKKNTQIGVRLSDELRDKLTKMADENKRTLSDYIRLLLEEKVEEAEKVKKSDKKI